LKKKASQAAEYVLAIDLGTSGCKAAIVDYFGTVHAWEFRGVETILPPGGRAEQDPEAWWRAITAACRAVVKQGVVPAGAIAAICANTQGEGTVPVDRDGKPLGNAILWMDTRGAALVRKRMSGLVNVSGYSPEKIVQYIWLTGGAPSLTGKAPVGHMLLIKQQQPDIYRRTHKFLNVLDYVNFRLTGRLVSTFDSIATSWLTDNRSPDRVKIDPRLCALIGIPPEKIPAPVPCTEILGGVAPDFAREVGLAPATPVGAGAIDATAAAVGAGTIGDGDTHLYLGTSNWFAAHVPFKKTDLLSAIASLPCAVPGKYLMIALQATACGNLTFLRDNLLFHRDLLYRDETPATFYQILDRLAESAPPGAHGLLYTPWIYGERAPVENQSIRAGFHNLSLEHTRPDLIRAVFEGVALNVRWLLKPVEKFLGRRCLSIAAVGGGAKSAVWCQIFADVLDRQIRQVRNPIEANVRGSAFIAAAALGRIRFDEIPQRVAIQATYDPQPQNRRVYDLHFAEFTNLYQAEKGIHQRLNAFHHRGR